MGSSFEHMHPRREPAPITLTECLGRLTPRQAARARKIFAVVEAVVTFQREMGVAPMIDSVGLALSIVAGDEA